MPSSDGLDEGFAECLAEAERAGMDLNDYLEEKKGLGDCVPLLEASTFPYLRPDAVVLEFGAGSGRWSRRLASRLTSGELHLVDGAPEKVDFLRAYFHAATAVHVHLHDGLSWSEFADASVDLVCSYGLFIFEQLGQFYCFGKECLRMLRPGGHVVLEFIDLDTESGWNWLKSHANEDGADSFTYHTALVIEELFKHLGFEIAKSRAVVGDFQFIVLRKPI